MVDEAEGSLAGLRAESLLVFAGAGVSVNAPSSMPAALKFLGAFYEECLPKSCDRQLLLPATDPMVAFFNSEADLPAVVRFEVVVSVVQQKFDARLELLDVFRGGRPNHNHRCLSELARRGALIITTNFDALCESACEGEYVVRAAEQEFEVAGAEGGTRAPEFWHLHGILADPRTGEERRETVVASVRDCRKSRELFRLDRAKGRALERSLAARDLLVVGYSGSDDFDIAPALEATRSERRLVWVHHRPPDDGRGLPGIEWPDGIKPVKICTPPGGETWYQSPVLNSLATMLSDGTRRRERVCVLRHDTARVLEQLAGLPRDEAPAGEAAPEPDALARHFAEWRRKFLPDEAARYLLAVLLCDAGGLREEGQRLLREFLLEGIPALNASPQDFRSPAAFIELLLLAVEADVLDVGALDLLPDFEEFLHRHPGIRAGVLTTVGRVHLREERVDEAVACFAEALRLCASPSDFENVEVIECEMANALHRRDHATGELAEADAWARKALQDAQAAANPEVVVQSTLLLARIGERLSEIKFAWANACYRRAREEAFNTGREALIAQASGECGLFLWQNGVPRHYEEAARFMTEAFRIHFRQETARSVLLMASNLALCLEALGEAGRSLMADCVAFNCAKLVGDEETARQALGRVQEGARRVLPDRDFGGVSERELASVVHRALVEDGVSI